MQLTKEIVHDITHETTQIIQMVMHRIIQIRLVITSVQHTVVSQSSITADMTIVKRSTKDNTARKHTEIV